MAENQSTRQGAGEPVKILYGKSHEIMAWHLNRTRQKIDRADNYAALGITLDDKIIASVIYTRYVWPDVIIGIESTDPKWCNRRTLNHIFSYPFVQLDCRRVTAITDPATPAVCHFLERLGFVKEGRLQQALPQGDALILGMLRDTCMWVNN